MNSYLKYSLIILMFISCKTQQIRTKYNSSDDISEKQAAYKTLFKKGDYGYACFRIPAVVVTKKGSILAFAEARKKSCSDTGKIDLVMRKSLDNGKSWGKMQLIFSDGNNVCGNPAPVVDLETGTIHLLSTWNNGEDHESEIIAGTSINSREVFYQVSTDDGTSWSKPKNITKSVKLSNWTWYATGPVHGIQLKNEPHKGRLVIPCDHITSYSNKYYSHVIYSDDHGLSWNLGGSTPNDKVNECTVAELTNGQLLLNMRNYDRDIKARQVAISNDGGISWENQHVDENLPEPICQGALINIIRNGKNVLLFTNPADTSSRVKMTLSVSRNNGISWEEKVAVFNEKAAYSDLAEMKNKKIFVLFEGGSTNAYEGIHFKIISIQ